MVELCLDKNAFSILQASTRANRDAILEAHDDRLFDGADEADVSAARARLTVNRDRIGEEISFLPELTPSKTRQILSELPDVHSVADAVKLIDSVPNLAKVNLAAELLRRIPNEPLLIDKALNAHEQLDPSAARRSIEEARGSSGFGPVRDEQWSDALSDLREAHAGVLAVAITKATGGPQLLASIVGSQQPGSDGWYRTLIDKVVDRYDRWTQPHLAKIEEKLDGALSSARAIPTDPALLKPIEEYLLAWDELRQPIQLRDQANGLDEPRSKRMFEKVRDVALLLANDHKQYRSARELSSVLHKCFPELPGAVAQLESDIEVLDELVDQADTQSVLQPLAAAVDYAGENLEGLGLDINRGHFTADGLGLAGELYVKFEDAREGAQSLKNPELPWMLLRSVAIQLNNDANAPRAAEQVIRHLLTTAPPSLRKRLEDDLATVTVVALNQDLVGALQSEDWSQSQELLEQLIDRDPGDRARYINLKSRIAQRQTSRTLKRVGWAAAAAFFIFIIVQEDSTPTQSSDWSSEIGSDMRTDTPVVTSSGGESDGEFITTSADEPLEETAPPAGYLGNLSRAQLRYCMFEEARIEVLDREVPPAAYSRFNARVSDFNSRCSGTRYAVSDRSAVEAQLSSQRQRLTEEARAILEDWLPAAPVEQEMTFPGEQSAVVEDESDPITDAGTQSGSSQEWLDNVLGNAQ